MIQEANPNPLSPLGLKKLPKQKTAKIMLGKYIHYYTHADCEGGLAIPKQRNGLRHQAISFSRKKQPVEKTFGLLPYVTETEKTPTDLRLFYLCLH